MAECLEEASVCRTSILNFGTSHFLLMECNAYDLENKAHQYQHKAEGCDSSIVSNWTLGPTIP